MKEKLDFAFDLYDINNDGFIGIYIFFQILIFYKHNIK